MNGWTRGNDSSIYRFEKRDEGTTELLVELEEYNHEKVDVRLFEDPLSSPDEVTEGARLDSLSDAVDFARGEWGIESDVFPENPSVRVNRLVLSLLADYVGADVVFGHDVPAETRDALAAAYETLDKPGLPLTFFDCPDDGAALNELSGESDHPQHIDLLECPECGEVYRLNRESGQLDVEG